MARTEADEVPWFAEPPPAHLIETDDGAWLHFIDPTGNRAAIPVTRGDDMAESATQDRPVWHIDTDGDRAIVTPSVHFVGFWHSPKPVSFLLVDELADGR